MKRYLLTSDHFTGSVIFGFNATGWLIYYKNDAEFNDQQHAWLLDESRLPKRLEQVAALSAKVKGTLKELPPDNSFDTFWNSYDKRINKKRAQPLFEKLSEDDQLRAIMAIKAYRAYCGRSGRGVADPEKYIRSEYWETDWSKEK